MILSNLKNKPAIKVQPPKEEITLTLVDVNSVTISIEDNLGRVTSSEGRLLAEFGFQSRSDGELWTYLANILKYLNVSSIKEVTGFNVSVEELTQLLETAEGFKFIEPRNTEPKLKFTC